MQEAAKFALFSIAMVTVMFHNKFKSGKPEVKKPAVEISTIDPTEVCQTQTCIDISKKILSRLNQKIDPCDDFYEFACGTFLNETEIPDDKFHVDASIFAQNQINQRLRVILNDSIQSDEIAPFRNAKRFFKACVDIETIEQRGTAPFLNKLKAMGGWPVTMDEGSWNDTEWTWEKSVAKARTNGFDFNIFTSIEVAVFSTNGISKRMIWISQAELGLHRNYLIKNMSEPLVKAYYETKVKLAMIYGAEKSRAEREMLDVLIFEIELAEISVKTESLIEVTVETLQLKHDVTNWLEYFKSILPKEVNFDSKKSIVVDSSSFFDNLGDLLHRTSKRTLANYVMWRHAAESVKYMPVAFKNLKFQKNPTKGKKVDSPRWLECVQMTSEAFSKAVNALYVRKYFSKNEKIEASEMVDNIKSEFRKMLEENTWLDASTKQKALEKGDKMKKVIGYPEEYLDDSKIEEFYASWPEENDGDQFFESALKLKIANVDKKHKLFNFPFDEDEWTDLEEPTAVNAFYMVQRNRIQIPAGYLQIIYFNIDRPKYLNYGAIGSTIGHEITHGFDSEGSQYDSNGTKSDWWEPKTKTKFRNKVQCIINQFDKFVEPITKLKVKGIKTRGENIADLGGIKQAYRAYVRFSKDNPKEPQLPGLNFTPQQMIWIANAREFCNVGTKHHVKYFVEFGQHSPARFRVNGPLSNLKEFADDFKCTSEAKMNPTEKCEVW